MALNNEIQFHEKKYYFGEDFSYRYKNEPIWRKHWERKMDSIYSLIGDLDKNACILNIGAGTGPVEFFFTKRNNRYKNLISSDISKNAISNIKILDLNNNLLICDATTLPFKDNSIEAIFFIGILHHIPKESINKLFFEIERVIKKEGFIIAIEPVRNKTRDIVKKLFHSKWQEIHSDDERDLEWHELIKLKDILQIQEIAYKPLGLFIDLLINVKINKQVQTILYYLYSLDMIFESFGIGWSQVIYIKFNKKVVS